MALSQDKANLIAVEYCNNGYDKTKALLSVGYAKNYAYYGAGHKLFTNDKVTSAIAKIETEKKINTSYTREIHVKGLEDLLTHNDKKVKEGNIQAIRAAVAIRAEIGASTGLHSQTINTDAKEQQELTDQQEQEAKRFASIRLREMA